jgi:hypothetical protein
VSGGLSGISGHDMEDLEKNVMATNNDIFKEDLSDIKYLQEKLTSLQQEEKTDEALSLERRVKRKVATSSSSLSYLFRLRP